ncbi:hypothetical protein LTR08_001473 [Meristemomyces frigidus]|nr:hypothetical protein LTR08_001473 [Meristemomyces frigidus]
MVGYSSVTLRWSSPAQRRRTLTPSAAADQRTGLRHFSLTSRAKAAPQRAPVVPDSPARTRFAPSPTGHLHIGGLRTALFSYLLAKRTGGEFLVRIEDTDQKRLVPGAEQRLLEDLRWAGLQWDEGPQVGGPYGPYKQSERNDIYQEHARGLLASGAAYRCFCTPQPAGQGTASYVTSGCYQHCASAPPEEADERAEGHKKPFTVRLKRPEDAKKRVYPDLIYGKITPLKRSATALASADVDSGSDAADTILIKSDGTPTYHFANVVDDHLMKITHVIRGTEWMASTPLHYDLYHAFGWTPPVFAHVGLLVDETKAKLSKRNLDIALDVDSMRNELGVLPETLVNFLALLGWSNPTDNDVMDMQQLVQKFDLKFTKGNAMVRLGKLWYLQKHHVARRCEEARRTMTMEPIKDTANDVAVEVEKQCPSIRDRFPTHDELREYCGNLLLADSKAYQNAHQYVQRHLYLFSLDAVQPPATQAFYDEDNVVSGTAIANLVETMLRDFDFRQPYRNSFAIGTNEHARSSATEVAVFENHSARIHAAMSHLIWAIVLQDIPPGSPPSSPDNELHQVDSDKLPFTDQPIDEAAFVSSFMNASGVAANPKEVMDTGLASGGIDRGPDVDAVLQRKKALYAAVMRYSRERLSHGLPGLNIATMMALLGYEECCKRLGVRARDGGGWA